MNFKDKLKKYVFDAKKNTQLNEGNSVEKRPFSNEISEYIQISKKAHKHETSSSQVHSIINDEHKINDSFENPETDFNDLIINSNSTQTTSSNSDYDIGLYINRTSSKTFSDGIKEKLLKNTWIPDSFTNLHVQVLSNVNRHFQKSWLDEFKWLAYSKVQNGAFCKNCVVFGPGSFSGKGSHQSVGQLVSKTLQNWKSAKEIFYRHSCLQYHQLAVLKSDNFLKMVDGKIDSVQFQVDKQMKKELIENTKKISAIIETIIFCGRQEIPLRGHKDYGRLSLNDPDNNDGNFRALLRYRAKNGDDTLKSHILNAGGKQMYSSPLIQNEIIELIGTYIQNIIIEKVKKTKFFTVLADETSDVQGIEQFSLVVRYFDEDINEIREDFLKFVPVHDVTGKGLATTVKNELQSLGLDLNYMRGQGYDGAAAMSGAFNGVQAIILEEYPMAIYTHCVSHSLNLVLNDASKLQPVRNCIGVIREISTFIRASVRRSNILKTKLCKQGLTPSRLMNYCDTRWVERHEAIVNFKNDILPIIETMEQIMLDNKDDETAARSFHKKLCDFEFLITLVTVSKMLAITHKISVSLQKPDIDLSSAIGHIELVKSVISDIRSNVEIEFKHLYLSAQAISSKLNVEPSIPRIVGIQRHRHNYSTNSPDVYYRISLFIPYLDELNSSLVNRFSKHKKTLVSLQNIIPINAIKSKYENIVDAVHFYLADFENGEAMIQGEWTVWVKKWKMVDTTIEKIPKNALTALKVCQFDLFPNIYILLKILCTIPITTASVERSFSTLGRLKTYIRNQCGNVRLTGLALMTIHRNIPLQIDDIVNSFIKKNRKMIFTYLFCFVLYEVIKTKEFNVT